MYILNQEKKHHSKRAAVISHRENTFETIMHWSNRNFNTPSPFWRPYFCKAIIYKYYISSLIYSILSKHMFTAVSDFSHRKKKKPDNSASIFPTTSRQRSNPHPLERLTNQIPHSSGTENSQMLWFAWGRVGGYWSFILIGALSSYKNKHTLVVSFHAMMKQSSQSVQHWNELV